ncbi:hypothetical protein BD289DRAFT_483456 [Coniella lustricola]|uniref:PLAC8 family-domain-containing protein n=1 Tax=Coniella lustricola TaxID=2025994 RepID=A0A2T3A5D1_9PEZI|nr:hypothetical protein BD289DRAFT_483456 [Coniella lustricola]
MASLPVGQDPYQQPLYVPVQAPYEDPRHGTYAPPLPGHGFNEHQEASSVGPTGDESVLQRSLTADLEHGDQQGLRDPGLSSPVFHEPYCGFCAPFSLCLTTCCLPCVTYGKTKHRLRFGNDMERYESCNGPEKEVQFRQSLPGASRLTSEQYHSPSGMEARPQREK